MKTTMGLGWKTLVSKIHPPLPMTPQQSQRLRTLLNTSFKQQLDQYRPSNLEENAGLHLQSVLKNPLFAASSRSRHEATALSIPRRRSDRSVGLIQELAKQPMDLLTERISAGTATFQTAALCLQAEARNCLASSAATVGDAMRASSTVSTILDWLWASNAETLGSLLEHSHFFRLLLGFLVAEKRHDRVWSWLQILQSNLDTAPTRYSRYSIDTTYSRLLLGFVKAEVSLGDGLDAALGIFVRAVNEGQPNHNKPFVSSAWYLTGLLMGAQKPAQLNYATIRAFMEATGTARKPNTLMSACHWVFLAETQDLTVALRYLECLQPGKGATESTVGLMALEFAKALYRKGSSEVLRGVDTRRKKFGRKVGDFVPERRLLQGSQHTDEESSLRLLGGLAMH